VFGISFSELTVIAIIALVVVGPQKLPGMLRTIGQWTRKLRKMTTEVRAQTGIDEILREEGIDGVQGLRSLLRGEIAAAKQRGRRGPADDPYAEAVEFDLGREHPAEGPDAYHAIPEDLLDTDDTSESAPAPTVGEAAVPFVGETAVPSVGETAVPSVSEATVPSVGDAAVPSVGEAAPSLSEEHAPNPNAAPPPFSATAPEASHSTTGKPS